MPPRVLVLGIGNLLWADEGFGVRCAEAFAARYALPPEVEVLDGGTQGLYLLPYVQEAERLVVFDAVDYGLAPGTLKVVEDGEVPRFMGAKKMSLHQTGFQEVISAAELTGRCPREMLLVGVQPQQLEDFGGSLTPVVRDRIPSAISLAADRLRRWGVPLAPRAAGTAPRLNDPSLERASYEAERPGPELA